MNTRPLPFEQIRAEAYFVGCETVDGYYTLGTFLREVPALAALPKAPNEFTRRNPDPHFRDSERLETADRAAYMRKLHEYRGSPLLRESVGVAARGLTGYARFRPAVTALLAALDAGEHVEPLGEGETTTVYPITVDGQTYATHIFREDGPANSFGAIFDVPQMHGGVEAYRTMLAAFKGTALARGHRNRGLAQLAAFEPAEGVCISPIVPGKRIADLTLEDIAQITPAHITAFINLLKAMHQDDLAADPNVSNIHWHAHTGFFMVDYGIGEMSDEDAGVVLETLARAIIARPESHAADEIVEDPEKARAAKGLLRGLRQRALNQFGVEELPITADDLIAAQRWRESRF